MALSLNADAPMFTPTASACYYYYAPVLPYDTRLQAPPSLQPPFYLLPGQTPHFEIALSQSRIVHGPDLYYCCYFCYYPPDQPAAAYAARSGHEQEYHTSCDETPPMPLQHPFPRRKATLTPLPDEAAVDGTIAAPVLRRKAAKKGNRALTSSSAGCSKSSRGDFVGGRRRARARQGQPVPHGSTQRSAGEMSAAQYEFKKWEIGASAEEASNGKTTVMIKNLPNKFTKNKLLYILDKHCLEENKKVIMQRKKRSDDQLRCDEIAATLAAEGDQWDGAASLSQFDFLYLPIDFKTESNMGYAFVNFTTPTAAWRLYNFLHNYAWNSQGSHKVCEVTYARIQGLGALTKHFMGSVFACGSDDFLPVRFAPPRDGRCQTRPEVVGRRRPPACRH